MKPLQGEITIKNNKITSKQALAGHSKIIISGSGVPDNIYNFPNGWIYPGFADSHGHVTALGRKLNGLNLNEATSFEECLEILIDHKIFRGEWLYATGWNHEKWNYSKLPTAKELDDIFPNTPVYLSRVDGHCALVNSKVLKIAGITSFTKDPDGGAILKDKAGNPNGILLDNAMELVKKLIPGYSIDEIKKFIKTATSELAKNGITEVHYMDIKPEYIPIYKELDDNNELSVRIKSFVQAQNDEWLTNGIHPFQNKLFSINGVKYYADGALGSRGAALLEPYSDCPSVKGLLLTNFDKLCEQALRAIENGFQIAVHCIGDAANHIILQVFDKLSKEINSKSQFRLEHCQIIQNDDLKYFKNNSIAASIQPIHCLSDAKMAERRVKERCADSYRWKSLKYAGATIIAGSDFPIESHNPLQGIDAMVNRIPFGENNSWYPDEIMSINDALNAYCINPKIVTNNSPDDNSFNFSNNADLTILDKNLSEIDKKEILSAQVLATFCNGKLTYQKT